MLAINQLSIKLGNTQAINDLTLEIGEGQIFGLLGPNGAGKTTLIRAIMGLVQPQSGDLTLFGSYQPGVRDVRPLIGYMPQQLALYPGLSVLENVLFYGRIYQMKESQLATRASVVIKMVELEKWRDELIVNLSGGMVRRVLLATALVHQPRLLILDEPTAGVDPLLRIRFWGWFEQMVSQGTSIIVTTHNISEAARCQQVIFLRKGALLTRGTPQQLMTQYQSRDLESAFVEATKELVSKEVVL